MKIAPVWQQQEYGYRIVVERREHIDGGRTT